MIIYRFEPYLHNACKRFVMDLKKTNKLYEDSSNKDINIAFYNIPMVKRYLCFHFSFCSQLIINFSLIEL